MITTAEILENVNMIAERLGYEMAKGTFDKPLSFLDNGLQRLEDHDGQLCFFPASFLDDEEHCSLRAQLLKEKDIIASIVLLSQQWPTDESEQLALLLLKAERGEFSGNVKFIDATDDDFLSEWTGNLLAHVQFPGDNQLSFPMEDEDSMDELSDKWDDLTCIKGTAYDILDGLKLNPLNYTDRLPAKDGFTLVTLEHYLCDLKYMDGILEGYSKLSGLREGHFSGKVLSHSDLKDSSLNYRLDPNSIQGREYEGSVKFIQNESVLVLSLKDGDSLKPTLISAGQEPIYIPDDDMIVCEESSINGTLDLDYLIGELYKDYVRLQLQRLRKRYSHLDWYSLGFVKFYVPVTSDGVFFLEKQHEIVQQERKDRICYLERELKEAREQFLMDLRERKRQISQFLFEQNSALAVLDLVRQNHAGILQDYWIVDEETGDTVNSYFKILHDLSDKLSSKLDAFLDGYID